MPSGAGESGDVQVRVWASLLRQLVPAGLGWGWNWIKNQRHDDSRCHMHASFLIQMVAAFYSSNPNLKSSPAKQLHFTVQNVNRTRPGLLPRDWKTDICAITSPELGHNSRCINNPEKKIWRWIIKSFVTRAAVSGRGWGGLALGDHNQCCIIILSAHPETQFSVEIETAHIVFSCLQHQLWYVYTSIINRPFLIYPRHAKAGWLHLGLQKKYL